MKKLILNFLGTENTKNVQAVVVLVLGVTISMILGALSGCGKENVLWIEPGYPYHVKKFLVKDDQGVWHDARESFLGYADDITFTKFNPLGSGGDGTIAVIDNEYSTTNYQSAGYQYDSYCGCYYQVWNNYTITTTSRNKALYRFRWSKESQKSISLDFTPYDPIIQGQDPNQKSFWEMLDRDYLVSFEGRKEGRLEADIIALKNESVQMVLTR
jgi:hypothetical protein